MGDRSGPAASLLLIFDGACGFCTWSVYWIKLLDRRDRVQAIPCQQPGLPQSVGLTRAQCEEAARAIEPSGRRLRGAAAVCAALAWALGLPVLGRICELPGIRSLAEAIYRWIATHRSRLPGGRPYCQQHPEACASPPGPPRRSHGAE